MAELRVLHTRVDETADTAAKALSDFADRAGDRPRIVAWAVAVVREDGSVGTAYHTGGDMMRLIAAVTHLQHRLIRET